MRKAVVFTGICLALSGCGNMRDTLGLGKNTPDEFAVVTRAPLSMPPTYELRPPQPGAPRPQEQRARDVARQTLVGQGKIPVTAGERGASGPNLVQVRPTVGQGEQGLLAKAGAMGAGNDAVRAQIDRETAQMESVNQSLLAQIRQPNAAPDPVVSPAQESRRVRELKQQNAPVSGSGTVTRAVKKPTLWDRLFGQGGGD